MMNQFLRIGHHWQIVRADFEVWKTLLRGQTTLRELSWDTSGAKIAIRITILSHTYHERYLADQNDHESEERRS